MKSKDIPGGIYVGFGIVAALFLSLYILLSFHNRPAADDFYFLNAVHSKGIWLTALDAYNTWITRWAALLFLGSAVVLFDAGQSLLLFQLFSLIALTTGAGWFLHKILRQHTGASTGALLPIYALLFVFTFFCLTFNPGETWFWFTSECMYLWPVIAFLYGSSFLLSKETKVLPAVLAVTCFLFIGGGSEVVALEVLVALLLLGFLIYKNKPFAFSAYVNKRLLLISLMAVVLSLFIAWLGQGRTLRQEALLPADFSRQCILVIQASLYFLLAQLPLKTHWLLFSIVPWLVLRNKISPGDEKPIPVVFRAVAKDFLFFLLFVILHFTLVVFLLRSFPPYRTWITLSLALAVFCAVTGWRLGSLVQTKKGIVSASAIYILAAGILLVATISSQHQEVSTYSFAVDERMSVLKNNSGKDKTILEVKTLPPAGMLYSTEISADTNYFTNKQLREYLELKSPVRRVADP